MCVYNTHMDSKAIIKRLKKEGWILAGGRGDHEKYKHPDKKGHVVVPHPKKDIVIGRAAEYIPPGGLEVEVARYVIRNVCTFR